MKVLGVLHRETRDPREEAFQPVDTLSRKTCTLALGLLVVVLFLLPLPGCAFEGEREVLTNRWKFPWSADAVQVDYSPGLQTFVYTHRYPGATNVSDSSVAFAYYEEGFAYRPGDIVVLDPDPPGGTNNTFIDLCFNASLMTDLQDYLCGVVAQLVAGGASGFVLGDEWPRGLNREEISISRLFTGELIPITILPPFLRYLSVMHPKTYVQTMGRQTAVGGATVVDILPRVWTLLLASIVFLALGILTFKV